MRFEILIQFIVPLMFLAIWALTSLLNRDAQPLAAASGPAAGRGRSTAAEPLARPARAPLRRPGKSGASTCLIRPWRSSRRCGQAPLPPPTLANGRFSALRSRTWTTPSSTSRMTPPGEARLRPTSAPGNRGERLFGITPAPREPSNAKGPGAGQSPATGACGQGRAEPKTHRALSDQVNQSMALQRNKPLEITPLFTSLAPLSLPLTQASVAPQVQQERGTANPVTLSGLDIRKMLSDPGKLREFALLTEVLQPPVSLRPAEPATEPSLTPKILPVSGSP